MQRIDLIRDSLVTSFSSTPISIGINQPLFGYNAFRWERRIEPLRYEEARRQYIEDRENTAIKATNYFFDLLNAQINVQISETNYSNNDTLYKIAKGRYNLGKIAENELLEMELNFLNAEASLEQNKIDYQSALFRFRSFLSLKDTLPVELSLPLETPVCSVLPQKAIEEALKNRPDALAHRRNLLEADRDLAKAKADNRFNINVFGVYGLTQTAEGFNNVYKAPLDQQQLVIGFQLPILDWGVSKGKIKMAESNRELVKTNVEQAVIDFEQEIFLKAMQYNMLAKQLEIAAKADTIAQKRYEVTKQRFLIGRIDIIPLNLAQEAKDLAKQSFINSLRNFWVSYYEMRKLTQYDFLKNKKIEADFNNL
ncbi:MAG: multidrug resistance outer membrane protein MdtQ [Bacteroidetes bacterium ADurb.Bin408]|nr:MAG: multidrug resistance outer membrane protein MdtQ [Bacteroidetes bacterium ADurb.Bin408]